MGSNYRVLLLLSISSLSAVLLVALAAPTSDEATATITTGGSSRQTTTTTTSTPVNNVDNSYFGMAKRQLSNLWGYASNLMQGSAQSVDSVHKRFQLPKMFDFMQFKEIFRKSYHSLAEEVVRQRLFLARAFRSFVSAIRYKHNLQSYYLRINQMSDWTPEEQAATRMHLGGEKKPKAGPLALASEEEIVRELAKVQAHAQEAGFATILKDMAPSPSGSDSKTQAQEAGRQKRDLRRPVSRKQQLTVQELITPISERHHHQEPPEIRAKMRTLVPSNTIDDDNDNDDDDDDNDNPKNLSFESGERDIEIPLDDDEANDEPAPRKVVGDEYFDRKYEQNVNAGESSGGIGDLLSGLAGQLAGAAGSILAAPRRAGSGSGDDISDKVYVDHRDSNCFFSPRNQGECGCCYAFAFIAYVEYLHCIETEALVPFSEQYMVDCGPRGKLSGCNGAPLPWAGKFILNFGLELRAGYPFRTREDQCPYHEQTDPRAMGYLRVGVQDLIAIPTSPESLTRQLTRAPVPVGIATEGTDFTEYGGGVHDPAGCPEKADHAVLLVGHGRENGKDYWLIRNSHGLAFGEEGYYKLAKRANCISGDGYVFGNGLERTGILLPEENPKNNPELVQRHYMGNLAAESEVANSADDSGARPMEAGDQQLDMSQVPPELAEFFAHGQLRATN